MVCAHVGTGGGRRVGMLRQEQKNDGEQVVRGGGKKRIGVLGWMWQEQKNEVKDTRVNGGEV